MTDAISRSAVLENARTIDSFGFAHLHYEGIMVVDVDDINDLPSLDAVPVVRCVDCKHRCTPVCLMYHDEYCDEGDGFYDDYYVDRTDNDGFCHLGERRDGEEDAAD